MKLKEFSFLIIFGLLSFSATAQHTISGYITKAKSGEYFEGVEVYDNEAGKSFRTNADGYFEIKHLSSGTYNLFFYSLGYEIVNKDIQVLDDDVQVEIVLQELSTESEVAVTEQVEHLFGIKRLREVEGTSIFAGKKNEVVQLDRLVANTASNNARQIYSQVSGLNIYDSGDAGLQLNIGGRGLDPNRSANFNTRQNGYDISADVLGYPESYYTPPAEALKEIQVIRGAASLQYGTQFGGLVNFVFKKPNRQTGLELISRQSMGSHALFTSFNSLSGTAGNLGYYGYLNYKNGNGFRPNSGYESANIYTHFDFSLSEKTTLKLQLTYLNYLAQQPGGLTDAQFYRNADFSNRSRNWFEVDWKLAALKVAHKFSNKKELGITFFGLNAHRKAVGFRTNRVSQQDDPDAPRDLLIGNFNNWGSEIRFLNRYALGDKNSVFLIGAKYYRSKNSAVQGPGSATDNPDFQLADDKFPNYSNQSDFVFPNQNVALFAENIFYLSDKFSITPGIRFEYIKTKSEGTYKLINFDLAGNPIQNETLEDNRIFDRKFALFGIGISYSPNITTEFYGNFSQNYRSVTFADIRVVNPSFQVDPNISDEKGFTADFGVRGKIGNVISYELGGFGLSYEDRLGEVLRAETRENASGEMEETGRVVRFRGNIGQAFMYGIESLADWNIIKTFSPDNRDYQINFFLNTALTKSQYFESEIAGVEGNEVEFIPLVNLKAGFTFGYRNLKGSLQYTYLSKQFTDASNALQNKNDNQSGIQGEIPAYDILDLSLSYGFGRFKIETGVNNLLNNHYFTQRATGYPGPGIIPSA
ncbi:MAG: TonB-dependent receptor, partial [Balneolaceae bacterium]